MKLQGIIFNANWSACTLEPFWTKQMPDNQNQQEWEYGVTFTFLAALLGTSFFQTQTKEIRVIFQFKGVDCWFHRLGWLCQ